MVLVCEAKGQIKVMYILKCKKIKNVEYQWDFFSSQKVFKGTRKDFQAFNTCLNIYLLPPPELQDGKKNNKITPITIVQLVWYPNL